jgi:hypothetical protein
MFGGNWKLLWGFVRLANHESNLHHRGYGIFISYDPIV